MPVIITRASNNYGPYQFPEKVLPLFVTNLVDNIQVPLYGDGLNVRDWLHVSDHCRAVDFLIDAATNGEVYNIGGGNEVRNIDLTHTILELMEKPHVADQAGGRSPGPRSPLRARHDEASHTRLGAAGAVRRTACRTRSTGIAKNEWWWRPVKERDPAFKAYYEAQYGKR